MFKTKINQYVPVPCTRAISDSWWLFFTDCPNFHLYTNTTAVAMANRQRATTMLAIVSTEDDRGGWAVLSCTGLGNARDGGDSGGETLTISV